MAPPFANPSSIHRRPSVKCPCINQNSHSAQPSLATVSDSPFLSSHAIAARRLPCSVSSLLSHRTYRGPLNSGWALSARTRNQRSEEHTSELQSHSDLVCRLLLE